ncbi:MAG: BON domain-containing protein [Planctomycetaceae bacterium]|nr:BON domain-containing protein [Planctomycetaceae bacterium]
MMAELCLRDAAALAKAALSDSRIFDLRRLTVVQDGDAVVLRGRVSSFYHKQLAQEVVRNATEGAEVINAIRVVYQAERTSSELERAG